MTLAWGGGIPGTFASAQSVLQGFRGTPPCWHLRFAISAAMSWLFPTQVELARGLGADTAIHLAGEPSVAAAVRPGGRVTSVTDGSAQAFGSDAHYVRTVVAPNGHELADLLFKLATHLLHSHVGRALSFDQVGDAVNPAGNGARGRTVLIR